MRGSFTQLQVIHALLLRETKTRFGADHLGYLWAIVQPAMWIGMFAIFYGAFGRMAPPGMSVLAFLTTGIIPFSLFRETTTRCLTAIDSNKGLLFYPQVRPLDLIVARAVLEAATQLLVMFAFMGAIALYEGPPRINSLLETMEGLALASALGASLGLVFCGLGVFSRAVERLYPALIRGVFWLSAVFHPAETLPKGMRDVIMMNPVVHAIELVRDGWFPGYGARHVDVLYPVAWILVLAFLGLSLERVARRRLELT